ncbi:Hypothetical protein D9617_22g067010 [Elsinoe fawcettii]|nr:Hypothetical protein D9617_22g067010 [Elsinoe fawcettii]
MHSLPTSFVVVFLVLQASIAKPLFLQQRDDSEPLPWATIGDSWASSVAYSDAVAYDGNKDKCLRSKESYTYLLEQDSSWRTGSQDLKFAACSGARLLDMADPAGQRQIEKTGDPRFVVMTVGGNDALFADVAMNCIYHAFPNVDYGPQYPDPAGACFRALEASKGYLDRQLGAELETAYRLIFQALEGKPYDINIYHTGYAHFFNVNSNWCNDYTFGVIPLRSSNQKLTAELRTKINDLVEQMNRIIESSVAAYQNKLVKRQKDFSDTGPVIPERSPTAPALPAPPAPPPPPPPAAPIRKLSYLDITRGFDGHRFCEDDSSGRKQYFGDDVWFWNAKPPGLVEPADDNVVMPPDALETLSRVGVLGSGGGNEISEGWHLRPFHPTVNGNGVIKDAIVQRLREDGMSGVKSVGSVLRGSIAGILAGGGKP